MSSIDQDPEQRVAAAVLIVTVLLAVGLALGVGLQRSRATAPITGERPAATVDATPAAVATSGNDASVVVEAGVVKFYFASGKAELASGALAALGEAIAAAQAGRQLVLSGYHDATGDPAMNAELARQRALAVRDALLGAGVAESRLELKKPEVAQGGEGSDAEARRVEVMIGG
jgi:outer membrane protein OmpA-like peptidoglycan-associated protein